MAMEMPMTEDAIHRGDYGSEQSIEAAKMMAACFA
jgi:hypothetical protein